MYKIDHTCPLKNNNYKTNWMLTSYDGVKSLAQQGFDRVFRGS